MKHQHSSAVAVLAVVVNLTLSPPLLPAQNPSQQGVWIQELFDGASPGVSLHGQGADLTSARGFAPGSTWVVNAGTTMFTANEVDLESTPPLPGLPPQAASAGRLQINGVDWTPNIWATRELDPLAQIAFDSDRVVYFSVRLNNAGDTGMGVGFASGNLPTSAFVGGGAHWDVHRGMDYQSDSNSLYVSSGVLNQDLSGNNDGPYAMRAHSTPNSLNGPALIVGRLTLRAAGADTIEVKQYDSGATLDNNLDAIAWTLSYDFTQSTVTNMLATHLLVWLNGGGVGELDAIRVASTWYNVTGMQLVSGPPEILSGPTVAPANTVNVGQTVTLSVQADGAEPLHYQWRHGNADVSGATGPELLFPSVGPSEDGLYTVVVSNAVGMVTSAVAQVTVLRSTFEQTVVALGPEAYWRLEESTGALALDAMGRHHAAHNAVTLGATGPRPPAWSGFDAGNLAPQYDGNNAYTRGPAGFLNNRAAFSLVGWINPTDLSQCQGLFGQNDTVEFGFGGWGTSLVLWTPGGGQVITDITGRIPNGEWSFVAAVGTGTNLSLYLNGSLLATGGWPTASYGSSIYSFNIGGNVGGGGASEPRPENGWGWVGLLDDIALFERALSAEEIAQLYLRGKYRFQTSQNNTGDTAGLTDTASATDLLQGLAPTYSPSPLFDQINGAAAPSGQSGLTDGSALSTFAGDQNGAYLPETFAGGRLPCTVTFLLNTTAAPGGYHLTKIHSFAGWCENGRTLANQRFELQVRPMGGSYVSLGTFECLPFTADEGTGRSTSLLSIEATSGGALASNVDSVRFIFQPTGVAAPNAADGFVIKELDVFGVPSPAALTLVQSNSVNTTGDTADLAAPASAIDLLQGLAPTYSRTPFFDLSNGTSPSGLSDGSATVTQTSEADGAYLPDTFAGGSLPCTVTFQLNTSVAPAGYDLTGVNSFAGWLENGRTLANQKFDLLVRQVGSADYRWIGSHEYLPFTAADGVGLSSSLISLTSTSGAFIQRVDSVQFVFQATGVATPNGVDGFVIKELDVFGFPSGFTGVALASPKPRQIIQRGPTDTADISINGILGALTGVQRIEARAVVMDGPTNNGTSTAWVTISTATSGAFSGVLPAVAAGGWYRIEVRAVNGAGETLNSGSVERVGVGDIFITAGQSNAGCFGSPAQQPGDDRVSAWSVAGTWQWAADPQPNPGWGGEGGSPWPILGTLLVQSNRVPVGFAAVAWGGSALAEWQPGQVNYANLTNALRALGVNGVRAVLWHQGETDSERSTSALGYAQMLSNVVAQSQADAGWTVPWGIAEASFLPSTTRAQEEPVAAGQRLFLYANPECFRGPRTDDFNLEGKLSDGVHFNAAGLQDHAQQWAEAILGIEDLTVKNGDFEANQPLGDGTSDQATRVIGWNRLDATGMVLADGNPGYFNPGPGTYSKSADSIVGGVLPGMSGRHAGTLSGGNGGNAFLQTLRAHLQPNTAYTLTVALGVRDNADVLGGYRLDLLANGAPLGSGAVGDRATLNSLAGGNAAGKFTVVSYTCISDGNIATNQQLAVRLTKTGGAGTYLDFDDVRMVSTQLPRLTIQISGDTCILNWSGEATLQAADAVAGSPWVDLYTGFSPYSVSPEPAKPQRYYRLIKPEAP